MREYPAAPLLGVGAIVLDGPRVLLIQRGKPPGVDQWSIPGGLVDVGERVEAAVRREVAEECGLQVRVHQLVGFVDRILCDAAGRVQYHYVLLDFLATPVDTTVPRAGDDARAVRWATLDEAAGLELSDGLLAMIRRARAMDPISEEAAR
jgi:ADP-ribose pyrophosphatase YjhB (NUDIX family)